MSFSYVNFTIYFLISQGILITIKRDLPYKKQITAHFYSINFKSTIFILFKELKELIREQSKKEINKIRNEAHIEGKKRKLQLKNTDRV